MAGTMNLIASDLSSGLAAAVQGAREFDVSDPIEAIRGTDVRRGIEAGRQAVGDAPGALAATVARFQDRGRRRSRRRPELVGLAIVILSAVALTAWWLRRRDVAPMAQDARFDRSALDRATAEGMGTAVGSHPDPLGRPEWVPVAMEPQTADARPG